jgi:hypothetical protein
MLTESARCQAEKLPQIQASKLTMAKLQRSRKEEEQRRKKNLPKLVRRRCNGGKRADGDMISQQCQGEEQDRRRQLQRA